MYILHEIVTRWTAPAVSAAVSTTRRSGFRRYATEDAALLAVCERVRDLTAVARVEPVMEATRSASGAVTVRALGVTFVVRNLAE